MLAKSKHWSFFVLLNTFPIIYFYIILHNI
ncbi:hypothetical protein CoNPh2_CDS0068 [Staphylococcus phage S-CoN_Ph2]|nr:hypothetical protein BE22_0158 [Staphylococcus phage vB_SepS_BE22]WNM51490.1 hypothetical protein CoNPh1_CDS0091 [Staphylococcus phage S-CoN_Ph1]WNM51622.1 hypothetical protein CoNPh2_CDS0068 [Staphylococcus phage S-CoN_Ph2]WNM51785.1 hypothetical protein CoNPh3_CDS0071 [Staphylococcus phage S-CoN_Ph3]WNM51971.1 hypothetical protein CoNPh4_CDS0095 [Staphylococcus phage S-CoN_Ph4]WNM52154.1 hypothetical protein CoNPh5_CDS0108 [Staphylococcus phage S-CoN_Ph5]WNM52283.1 hypothetical protein C